MAQDERLQAAEQLLARERMLQEMRANALQGQQAARRKLMWICIPLGSFVGSLFADSTFSGAGMLLGIAGAFAGWAVAALVARRIG